jgi:flagellar biosynthesis/type III secretory pathway protein FliH
MTTSSSDTAALAAPAGRAGAAGPMGLKARIAVAASPGVRSALPVRVVDRTPPPPPIARIDVAPLVRALEAGFADVRGAFESAFGEIERECIELALAAAERVVRRRCERGELDLEAPLRELLAARRRELAEQSATLRVHPDDAPALQAKLPELAPPGARVEVVADPAVARGSLALELGAARVTRSLPHELARLRARLLEGSA